MRDSEECPDLCRTIVMRARMSSRTLGLNLRAAANRRSPAAARRRVSLCRGPVHPKVKFKFKFKSQVHPFAAPSVQNVPQMCH
jgi:hypothetical protein